ncbi:ABC transporter ATP-binding protein [Rhizobium leguminosarum]|uniref:ABC transporter ATP-binding protein n=1 Tax=Rhizobium leguminosarum TaxID=384 RepID=UPI001C9439ED|nr:ABC transporter ATP-binding protein [Rhizobium leguminosarum]MBY5774877.1 ABC transporter ATP-binding protein [Rhizobium leguminosarum]
MISAPNITPVVSFKDVTKSYGKVAALKEINLQVDDGEFLTVLGPTGSGKSTLLGMIVGSVLPSEGVIRLEGRDITRLDSVRCNVGAICQRDSLLAHRTVAENVAYPLQCRGAHKDQMRRQVISILALLDLVIDMDRYPSEISRDQTQRVLVARALVAQPSILLMDEPLAELEKAHRNALQDEIKRIQRALRVPTIYATHDRAEALQMSDRIVVISDGRIVADGTPRDLYERPPNLWCAQFLGTANILTVRERQRQGLEERVICDGGLQFIFDAADGLPDTDEEASVMIRPERCHLAALTSRSNAVTATVMHVRYLGGRQRVTVQLESGGSVIADVPGHWRPPEIGSAVLCSWDSGAARLVKTNSEAKA